MGRKKFVKERVSPYEGGKDGAGQNSAGGQSGRDKGRQYGDSKEPAWVKLGKSMVNAPRGCAATKNGPEAGQDIKSLLAALPTKAPVPQNTIPQMGDWWCPNPICHDLQFSKNVSCRLCGTPKPENLRSAANILKIERELAGSQAPQPMQIQLPQPMQIQLPQPMKTEVQHMQPE